MSFSSKSLEQYESQVDEIKKELEALKLVVNQEERKQKETILVEKASVLETELFAIQTAELDQTQKEKISSMIQDLQKFTHELQVLQGDITTEVELPKEPSFREKTVNLFSFKDSKKSFNGIASMFGLGIGGWSIWKLFSGRSKEQNQEHKKKSRWGRARGNVKRYTGIALGAVGGFLGIRWLSNYYAASGDPETLDGPVNKINQSRDEFKKEHPEQALLMSQTAGDVNDYRAKQIFQSPDGRLENDMLGETTGEGSIFDKEPGAIVHAMSMQYETVKDMLDPSDYVMNLFQNMMNKPYYAMKDWLTEKGSQILKFFAGKISGILPSFWGNDGNLTEEGRTELMKQNPTRDAQLQALFGKYMRVKLWYQIKVQQLREKLARDALGEAATSGDIQDYLDEEDNLTVINEKINAGFLSKNLMSAMQFLKKNAIPNDTLPAHLAEPIADINEEHATYKTDEFKAIVTEQKDIPTHKQHLTESCDKFILAVASPIVQRNWVESMFNVAGIDIFFNATGQDIDAIAKQMGYQQIVDGYKTETIDISSKISDGTATHSDIQRLNALMESFRLLQIETTLGGLVKNESDGEGGRKTTIKNGFGEWILNFTSDDEGNTSWLGVSAVIIGGMMLVMKSPTLVWKAITTTPMVIKKTYHAGAWVIGGTLNMPSKFSKTRGVMNGVQGSISTRWMAKKYQGIKGHKRLLYDIENDAISVQKAKKVWDRVRGDIATTKTFEKLIQHEFGMSTAQLEKEKIAQKEQRAQSKQKPVTPNHAPEAYVQKSRINAALQADIDSLKNDLANAQTPREKQMFDASVASLEEFQTSLTKLSKQEIDSVGQLYDLVKQGNNTTDFIEAMKKVHGLMHTNSARLTQIQDAINKLDSRALRQLKNSGSDDALEIIAKLVDEVNIKKLRGLSNGADVLKSLKILMKIVAKAT